MARRAGHACNIEFLFHRDAPDFLRRECSAHPRRMARPERFAGGKTSMPGEFTAQPLEALPLYGCGVPLAGVSPEQIKSFGPPGAWDMPRGTEQAEQVMPVTLNFCFIGFTRLSNVREGSRAAPTSKYGPGWPRTHRSSVRARHRWRPPAHSASGARPKFPCWRG